MRANKKKTYLDHLIGSIQVEEDTGLRFQVTTVTYRPSGDAVVAGRCIDHNDTGRPHGADTYGEYCANIIRKGAAK